MDRRLLRAWPYLLALVVGFLSWPLVEVVLGALSAVTGAATLKDSAILMVYIGYPLALLVGAAVLGFRRGYDWVTLLACLAVYLIWPAVACLLTTRDWRTYAVNWGMATLFFFIPATQIGLLLGLGLRRRAQVKRQRDVL